MTQVHYSSDGEQSGVMELDTLIANLEENYNRKCFHGDAIDLIGLRKAIESGRMFIGYHDFGRFVVSPILTSEQKARIEFDRDMSIGD